LAKKTVADLDVAGKKVFLRVDFNVPLDEKGNITDDTRIRASLPTINYLIQKRAKVIIVSHLGRPKGKVVEELRLTPVANRLSELLGREVKKAPGCIGEEVEKMVADLKEGEVLLLENVRFCPGEEKNDPEFAKKLASLADIYVNDAFGTAHRAHASTEGVAHFLPAVAGFLMQKELETLGNLLENPPRPFLVILGGAKVSDKIGVIYRFLDKADVLLIGGGMANTFLKASGLQTGKSLVEEDKIEVAKEILTLANEKEKSFYLPEDLVVVPELKENAPSKIVKKDAIPLEYLAVDIGPETIKTYKAICSKAKTIFWNGPMGVFEMKPFAKGTYEIAEAVANSAAVSIIGGGDTVAAVEQSGLTEKINHISTGGGASLEFLEGKELPGVKVLADK